jgi:predicted extracellular nuclease
LSRSSLRRLAGPAFAGCLALVGSVLPVFATPAAAASPDLVISQVYGGGGNAGAPFTHDYVELFNRGSAPVTTADLSVQYASATGTGNFQAAPLSTVTVPAGGYYLLQLAGGSVGAALPTADATGTLNLSGTAGKVVLVDGTAALACNGGSAPCTAEQSARIVDLVGFGNANFAEGSPAPTLSSSTAAFRAGGGCTDTDANAADFAAGPPSPRTSATAPAPCGGSPGPASPSATCPATLSVDVSSGSATAPVSATDADSRVTSATLTAPPTGVSITGFAASTAAGAPGTATLTVAPSTALGTYSVEVVFDTDAAPAQSATCTVQVVVLDGSRVTPVSAVQGPGAVSPLVGQRVRVEAVVTSLITSRDAVDGFFVQERVADADPATSEGVYVFCRTLCPAGLAGGDLVRVTGDVAEFGSAGAPTTTQVDASTAGSTITVLQSGVALPPAAVLTLPAATSTEAPETFERYEGMRTTISTTLAVAEYFAQAQFGEIVLEAGQRSYQYTQTNTPSVAGYAAFLADLERRRIVLDDASNDQNDAITGTVDEPYLYPTDGLSLTNRFRGGDTITGLTGVMEYAFGSWRLRPVVGQDYTFTSVNPRPTAPDPVGGRLQVASFNVLNYFADIDTTASNSSGTVRAGGTDDCRGATRRPSGSASSTRSWRRCRRSGADVFGLIEIQNDSGRATQQIVDALNAVVGVGTYDFVRTGVIGTDAIKQALVYDTRTVEPVGAFDLLTTADDPRFVDTRNRRASSRRSTRS